MNMKTLHFPAGNGLFLCGKVPEYHEQGPLRDLVWMGDLELMAKENADYIACEGCANHPEYVLIQLSETDL